MSIFSVQYKTGPPCHTPSIQWNRNWEGKEKNDGLEEG